MARNIESVISDINQPPFSSLLNKSIERIHNFVDTVKVVLNKKRKYPGWPRYQETKNKPAFYCTDAIAGPFDVTHSNVDKKM